MKSILAVLLFVGLSSAFTLQPKGQVTDILKDLQQKLTQDAKTIAGHAKENTKQAVEDVKEAAKAISSKAPKESLKVIQENLKDMMQKVVADGRDDSQAVLGHLKEAYDAVQSALRPSQRILYWSN